MYSMRLFIVLGKLTVQCLERSGKTIGNPYSIWGLFSPWGISKI